MSNQSEQAKRVKEIDAKLEDTKEQLEFFDRAKTNNLAPLWKVLAGLVTKEPNPRAIPSHWRYSDVRPYILESCGLVSTEDAERRVMVLENPGLTAQSRISDSLFAGFQIIMPGEVAPVHRHTAAALRFIIEGSQAYTAVNGERTMMLPGDFVTTPSWVWHDHANVGNEPMVWLDGLDMHIVNMLNASFREEMKNQTHEIVRPDDSTTIEYGNSMVPANYNPNQTSSPILNYPYVRTKEALNSMRSHSAPDAHLGYILKYINPLNGDWAMPTLATNMRMLPQGFATMPYQSTDSTVFVVVEGSGTSQIGDKEFHWSEHDVFVAPSWSEQRHLATTDAVIFTYSDRAVQEKIGLWREKRSGA